MPPQILKKRKTSYFQKAQKKALKKPLPKAKVSTKAWLLKQGVCFGPHVPSSGQCQKALSVSLPLILVICDKKLKTIMLKSPLKNTCFYFVKAGEGLKDLQFFYSHVLNILKLARQTNIKAFISVGGGSVGDFTGFLASIWQRGVGLIHIPTTALAMLDSAHGAKTALNAGGIKNLFGSYHVCSKVFIIKQWLLTLSKTQLLSAKGELLKIALIKGGRIYQKLLSHPVLTVHQFWALLPMAIQAKLQIVKKDPRGKKTIRHKLNLGHTVGHILEAYFNLPHGEAIGYGISFALWWSYQKRLINTYFYQQIKGFLNEKKATFYLKKLPTPSLYTGLLKDKKIITCDYIHFVFIKKPGLVVVKKTSLKSLLKAINTFALKK